MREKVRPWLEVTRAEAGFTLIAHTLGSLATGRKKLFTFLQDRLSITVENLRPPRRKNKKRTKKRAVERFEGEVEDIVKRLLMIEYHHLFHSKHSRENYAKQLVNIITKKEEENFQERNEVQPWKDFKVGRKQKINIQIFLKKRITFD